MCADTRSCWTPEHSSLEETSNPSGGMSQSLVDSKPFAAQESSAEYVKLQSVDNAHQKVGADLHVSLQNVLALGTYEQRYPTSIPGAIFADSYPPWANSVLVSYPQPDTDFPYSVSEERMNPSPGRTRHPLQDYAARSVHEDPWSLPGHHPSSASNLVLYHHPFHKGYGSTFTVEAGKANVRLTKIVHGATSIENGLEDIPLGHPASSLRYDACSTLLLPRISTPASPQMNPNSQVLSHLGQPTAPHQSITASIPMATQHNWDSKTGEPLVKSRNKRRQSTVEKISSQAIRRKGGQCNACRIGHRKVTFTTASLL